MQTTYFVAHRTGYLHCLSLLRKLKTKAPESLYEVTHLVYIKTEESGDSGYSCFTPVTIFYIPIGVQNIVIVNKVCRTRREI
jgi:hypothetical protein